jgi:sigma-B regulation protein RsbU (phosphoserine phosphatase)
METPVVFQYQQSLHEFRAGGVPDVLLKRMSELISLLDLTTTLGSGLAGSEILDAALLIVMGELQARRGCFLVREQGGEYRVRAARGLAPGAPASAALGTLAPGVIITRASAAHARALESLGLDLLCPILKAGRPIAALGLGARADGRAYGREETAFLESVAACSATPIENGLIYDELKRLNQRLSVKVFQLHNLFDVSRELTSTFDEGAIQSLVTTTLMGHLMVSRCAVYRMSEGGLVLAHARGLGGEELARPVPEEEARPVLEALKAPLAVSDLAVGPVRERLAAAGMALLVPLAAGSRALGFLAMGARASGVPFTEEDREFAQTLARQAVAALESVRLHRLSVEQQRRDREMQIAREIQQSLFPESFPDVPGFEVFALSLPCYEVGGDHYDVIPLPGGRLAVAIADVSGKGAPASILMASVHASLRALAGTAPPAGLMQRINRFLFENTQANRYATVFYGELDPASRRLSYVNGGHIPPYCIGPRGRENRLGTGGPALGVIEDAVYEEGVVELEKGDLVAMVTDGVTEAASVEDHEFGDEHVIEVLHRMRGAGAEGALRGLVEAVHAWTGPVGCADDLTALVLRAL